MNNEEQELRNAAQFLRKASKNGRCAVAVTSDSWASMLERAADRIEQLEAYIQSQGLVA